MQHFSAKREADAAASANSDQPASLDPTKEEIMKGMCLCVHVCVCEYVCMYVCVSMCVCVCVCIYIYIYIYINTHTHT
jgi:hypothetical protein